jgi:Zn-dependent oligopeptidase
MCDRRSANSCQSRTPLLMMQHGGAFPFVSPQHINNTHTHALQGFTESELKWWDVSFWAERLREARYALNEEELRPYFALPQVCGRPGGMRELSSALSNGQALARDRWWQDCMSAKHVIL